MIRKHSKPVRRRRRKPLGALIPGGLLTKDGCMKWAGFGRNTLDRGEIEGHIDPHVFFGKNFYEVDELLAWVRKSGVRKSQLKHRRKVGT